MSDPGHMPEPSAAPSVHLAATTLSEQSLALETDLANLRHHLVKAALEKQDDRMALLVEVNERLVQAILAAQAAMESANSNLNKLTRLSQHDVLTDTPNRALMLDRLRNAISMAQRRGTRTALFFLDIDNFKQINDQLGHAVGDGVLQLVARRLEASTRESDTVGRYGGDEFLVLLPEVFTISDASGIAKKILDDMTLPARVGQHDLTLSISIGIALYPDDSAEVDALIELADTAMYCSKRKGGGQYFFHGPEPELVLGSAPKPEPE